MPAPHSRRLVQAWGGPHELMVFDDGDHNQVPQTPYWDAIGAFLRQLAPTP